MVNLYYPLCAQTDSGVQAASCSVQWVSGVLSLGVKVFRGVYLVPRSRMHRAILELPYVTGVVHRDCTQEHLDLKTKKFI